MSENTPMWQQVDIFLSREWDDESDEWKAEHSNKAAYMNDEKNRARAQSEIENPSEQSRDIVPSVEPKTIEETEKIEEDNQSDNTQETSAEGE
jgi:hypothetical protein